MMTSNEHPYTIGDAVIVRTVTMYYTGRIVRVYPGELVLSDAAWIGDAGQWSEALKTGILKEVEPYPDQCIVSRAAIVDVAPWAHPLPRNVVCSVSYFYKKSLSWVGDEPKKRRKLEYRGPSRNTAGLE